MGTDGGGRVPFGPQSDIIPETCTAPEFGQQPSSKGGDVPFPLVASVQPEAPDDLLEALQGASIVDEHRVLMGMVIKRFSLPKAG